MRYYFSLLLLVAVKAGVQCQTVERKIIIQNNQFYYVTIDEEFQVGTLHAGKFSAPLNKAKHLALPAGRNYNLPVNPFVWDVCDTLVYAVNFLNHPLNDRYEALKRFSLASLNEWDSTITVMDVLMKSVDQNMFARNEPYGFVTGRSNVLNNFYFDAVVRDDSSFCMAIANNGELSIWKYDGKKWTHGEIQKKSIGSHFTLFAHNKGLYLLFSDGFMAEVTPSGALGSARRLNGISSQGIILVNKDNNTVQFINSSALDVTVPLNELIKEKALKIF